MIIYQSEERMSDSEYSSIIGSRDGIILPLDMDPADNAVSLHINNVYSFNLIGFGKQNVISYIEYSNINSENISEFMEQYDHSKLEYNNIDINSLDYPLLGVVIVPSNGATIFTICKSISKIMPSGESVYTISPV